MVLDTTADVDEIQAVQDRNGDARPAANADEQQRIAQALENQDAVTLDTKTTSGTTAEQLPSHTVPEGVSVLIMALDSNDANSRVYLGDANSQPIPLKPEAAVSWNISDTGLFYIQTPTAGDGVAIGFEG